MDRNIFVEVVSRSRITRFVFFIAMALLASCADDDNRFVIPADDVTYYVHFIDVGQGDAIFVETPGKNVLVDAGWRSTGTVPEYLHALEVETIDIVIGTHAHADHIGGLIDVFYAFDVGEVIDPGVEYDSQTYRDYITTIDFFDIPLTYGRTGMEWELSENAHMRLLHPANPDNFVRLNNTSIVAHITLGEITVLLTGDLEKEGEAEILQDAHLLRSHILKVGHHGSNTSSTMPFLEAVAPEVSIIQCGRDNDYGHPHEPVLQRLTEIGTAVYRTDIHGTILIETDGETYDVTVHYTP